MINSVQIENFGMHKNVEWKHLQHINLLLGVNGTGKTFILKALYVAMRTLEQYKRGNAQQSLQDILQEKLHWTFQTDRLGDLVNKTGNAKLSFAMTVDNNKSISYEFGRDTVKKIVKAGTTFEKNRDSNTVFIPAKEVLSLQDVILKSREQDMMYGFDDTYLDLVKALQLPRQRGNNYQHFADGRKILKDILGGTVDYDEKKHQWYYKKGNTLYSINTTAEGIKKIAIFNQLLANRYLTPRSIVFLDEIESSLHPKAVVEFLRMLYELSKSGMQFFIATHSYFAIKELYLLAQKNHIHIPVLSLKENNTPSYDDLLAGMPDNSIIDESIRLYEREVDLSLGDGYAEN
ncbi:MAG: AAA family ATPase [Selenomonadaceae bacterium]|nr:AAA family ATPase [Selenomonadaceae bacterium]